LEVTGTDQDLTISTEVVVAGQADGVVVAPGRLLTDIVQALLGRVAFLGRFLLC